MRPTGWTSSRATPSTCGRRGPASSGRFGSAGLAPRAEVEVLAHRGEPQRLGRRAELADRQVVLDVEDLLGGPDEHAEVGALVELGALFVHRIVEGGLQRRRLPDVVL